MWTTILGQIGKQDAFDGKLADTILEIIRDFLEGLDGETINSLWEETDMGMQSECEAEELHPDEVRQDLSMELLDEVTRLAWEKAKRKGW